MKKSGGKVVELKRKLTPEDEEYFCPKESLERAIEADFESVITFGIKDGKSHVGWSNMEDLQQVLGALTQMQTELIGV